MGKTVGARELKSRLGAYIHQVREGANFFITERGIPVAELRPLAPVSDDDVMKELVGRGILTRLSFQTLPPLEPVVCSSSLSAAVLEEREERF